LVAGSVGPTGDLLAPLGALSRPQAVEVFSEQIEALVDAGVDVVWIETHVVDRGVVGSGRGGERIRPPGGGDPQLRHRRADDDGCHRRAGRDVGLADGRL
jgi:hypothetical protein